MMQSSPPCVLGSPFRARDLTPNLKPFLHFLTVGRRGKEMSSWSEVLGDRAIRGQKALRMHQTRHRHDSQGMLDLKRLFWNCRAFTHGRRRGASPYQLLGLNLPTDDRWELLQMDPDVVRQKLSTQEVAA